MQRRFLAIATIALVFLTTAALHLAVTQVALAQDTAADAPAPPPMRITFRQTIPLTITVAATAPLTSSANLTAEGRQRDHGRAAEQRRCQ
jgi:hypothetical protein